MTTANGLAVSDPMLVDNAAGNKPSIAIKAVMTTGRKRLTDPLTIASCNDCPSLRNLLKFDTNQLATAVHDGELIELNGGV